MSSSVTMRTTGFRPMTAHLRSVIFMGRRESEGEDACDNSRTFYTSSSTVRRLRSLLWRSVNRALVEGLPQASA